MRSKNRGIVNRLLDVFSLPYLSLNPLLDLRLPRHLRQCHLHFHYVAALEAFLEHDSRVQSPNILEQKMILEYDEDLVNMDFCEPQDGLNY